MMTKDNIASHELIGLETQIVDSNNKGLVGVTGKIVDETKFMFILDTKHGIKKFPKESTHWKFVFNGNDTTIDGTKLTKRPYERLGVKA